MIPAAVLPGELHHVRAEACHWLVEPGDNVIRGQLLAAGVCPVHAAASGTVAAINGHGLTLRTRADDREMLLPSIDLRDRTRILARIRDAGIAGLGGGGFPTYLKLLAAARRQVHTLIVNAVECGTGITCDAALIREDAEGVRRGIDVLRHLLGVRHTIIACSPATAFEHAPARTEMLATVRPTDGAERYLLQALANVVLAPGQRPIDQGHVVCNVATVHAIQQAMTGRVMTERIATVAGVDRRVRFGTPFAALLTPDPRRTHVRVGGELDGRKVPADGAVDKRTNAIAEVVQHRSLPCIQCGACDSACPERLPVADLVAFGADGAGPQPLVRQAAACIECGLCNPVCPSDIDVLDGLRRIRARYLDAARRSTAAKEAQQRAQRREARLATYESRQAARRAERLARIKAGGTP